MYISPFGQFFIIKCRAELEVEVNENRTSDHTTVLMDLCHKCPNDLFHEYAVYFMLIASTELHFNPPLEIFRNATCSICPFKTF